jgi:O-antigen ligase
MRSDAKNANRLSSRLLEGLTGLYVGTFLVLYITDAIFPALHYIPFVHSPVELFCILAAPVLVRVHWPDYRQNALTSSLALWRDHRQVIVAFLGLITLSFLTALEPGANVADRGGKAVYILLYRFGLFAVALSTAILLIRLGWRWPVVIALLVLLGSIFYDVAYPGTFSTADGRAGGFQENPNVAAIAVMMLLAVSVRYDRVHSFDLLLILAAAVGVFATLSRGGMMQLSLFLANYLYFTGRGRRLRQILLAPLAAAAMAAAALSVAGLITTSSDMFQTENAQRRLATFAGENETVYETDTARLSLIPQYMALIDRHMLLGYGTGFSRSLPLGPHNSYLDFWVNNGFAGLLLYLWLLVAMLSLCWARRFWPGLVFTQIALLAGMFTHDVIHLGVFLILSGLILGISWGTTARATPVGLADRAAEGGAAVRRHPATAA